MKKKQKLLRKINNLRYFFRFFYINKILGINFLLLFLTLFLLPANSYYSEIQLVWHKPQVMALNFNLDPPALIPKINTSNPAPLISAKSALVLDVPSGIKLYRKSSELPLLPASTTKMMTALVSLESYRLDQVIEVKEIFREGQDISLEKGEKLTVESLLYDLLVASANDSAEVLALNYPGGREKFIERMNEKAQSFQLKNTHYVNPSGIDEEGQYTSAIDLARLAEIALKNPFFAKLVSTQEVVISSIDQKYNHPMTNINTLLKIPGIKGVKTGWTELAGECLVGYYEKDNRKLITVVLGSNDRFGETTQLLDWVNNNYLWKVVD